MATIVITREQAIEALRGEWVPATDTWIRYAGPATPAQGCAVCAVGAVLRAALAPDVAASAVQLLGFKVDRAEGGHAWPRREDVRSEALDLALDGRPLSSLSVLYEGLARLGTPHPVLLDELCAFVAAHWPAQVTVDVGDALERT